VPAPPKEPEGPLTLRHAIGLALLGNPALAASSWDTRIAEARTLQARLRPNPEVEAGLEDFAGMGALSGFGAAEATLSLGLLVELGGKRAKRVRLVQLAEGLAAWDYEARRLDALTDTAKAFVEVLAVQERASLGKELLAIAEEELRDVAERVRTGKVAPLEADKARVARAASQIALEKAQRELAGARKRLAALWGSTTPSFERAEGRLDTLAPLPPAERLEALAAQNPDVARWAAETEQREAALALEKAKRLPDLSLSGGIKHAQETLDQALTLGLGSPLPLFDRNQGGVLEAEHSLAKAQAEQRAAALRAHAALATAYQELASAHAEATILNGQTLPAARAAFEAARTGYQQGKLAYLDVLDAQRTLFEARGDAIAALAAYHTATADVERLIGQSLSTLSTP